MFTFLPQLFRGLAGLKRISIPDNQEKSEANVLIKKILHIHAELASKEDLEPCAEVNELYSDLVDICTLPVTEEFSNMILENDKILKILHDLRNFCSIIEFNTEKHWSIKAAGTEDVTEQAVCKCIENIPHIDINMELISDELSAMRVVSQKLIESIAIVGSGPLPLTGLGLTGMLFGTSTDIRILNIDRELNAIEAAKKLCNRLGSKAKGMEFLCAEAGSAIHLSEFDVVYLAILVGNTQQEKELLLKNLVSEMRPGALLIVRGTTKLKRLMYSVFDPNTKPVAQILDVETVIYPKNHYIVDTVTIGRVKAS
ncbi:putative nicotianamine synthase [Erysiphe necator]|uniref:Putative nicotianamine synthase n=1 Tax=Uncinula necator TaxID=52586 RepID=A0A0B1P9R8_UNCNE|nr:putative nicotianamine synthase [Erysiphe necator]